MKPLKAIIESIVEADENRKKGSFIKTVKKSQKKEKKI